MAVCIVISNMYHSEKYKKNSLNSINIFQLMSRSFGNKILKPNFVAMITRSLFPEGLIISKKLFTEFN